MDKAILLCPLASLTHYRPGKASIICNTPVMRVSREKQHNYTNYKNIKINMKKTFKKSKNIKINMKKTF